MYKLFLTLFFLCIAQSTYAFRITPFTLHLRSNGYLASQTVTVENNTPTTKAIAVSHTIRDMDANGVEVRHDDEENTILIFPLQMVLRPGEKQNVRIEYTGSPNIEKELAYRVNFDEVPLKNIERKSEDNDSANGMITVLLSYESSIYIQPQNQEISPKLILHGYKHNKEQNSLIMDLENKGTKHIVLHTDMFDFGSTNNKIIHECEEVINKISNTNLLATKRINLEVPLNSCKAIDGSLKLDLQNK